MERLNKTNYRELILDVIVYLSIAISTLPLAEKVYNLLPFYSFSGMDFNVNSIFARIFIPLLTGGIFYLLYSIFTKYIANTLNVRMMLYDKRIEKRTVKNILNPIFIGLSLYVGLVETLFLFYPYLQVALSAILKEVGIVVALFIMIKNLSSGLDKIFKPVIVYSMMWPAVLMVMLV